MTASLRTASRLSPVRGGSSLAVSVKGGAPPDGPDADAALVTGIRAGDAESFGIVFHAYYTPLCNFAKRFVRTREASEELVQDVLLKIWEHRGRWLLRGTLRSYLYTAVRNQALDLLKHERVAQRWRRQAAREQVAIGGRASASAEDGVSTEELAAVVERVVAALPARCRQAYVLRRVHHLSHGEIARVMGTAPKTVEIQIGLALKALRRELVDWLPTSSDRRAGVDGRLRE